MDIHRPHGPIHSFKEFLFHMMVGRRASCNRRAISLYNARHLAYKGCLYSMN